MEHYKTAENCNIYIEEEVDGELPVTPAPQAERYVSCDLEGSYETIENDTKFPGRSAEKNMRGTNSNTGNFTAKFAPREQDKLWEALLCSEEGWVKNTSLSDAAKDVYDIVPGAKQRSFYLLKEYTQDPVLYQLFRGLQVNSLNIQFTVNSLVNVQFNLMGSNNPKLEPVNPIAMGGKIPPFETEQFTTLSGFVSFKGPDDAAQIVYIDCSDVTFDINNNMSTLAGLFQTDAIDKAIGKLSITGSISEYVDTGKLYNYAKDGADGELHLLIGNDECSYEFIMKISFDNSTLGGDAEISAALPFTCYGNDRFVLRRTAPPVAVTGVSVDPASLSMNEGDTETLVATVEPENASNKGVTWQSDDTDIATVADGVVTAVAAGTANITVETDDGNFTASCGITVS
jgi:uncharacterized protein YjdB